MKSHLGVPKIDIPGSFQAILGGVGTSLFLGGTYFSQTNQHLTEAM